MTKEEKRSELRILYKTVEELADNPVSEVHTKLVQLQRDGFYTEREFVLAEAYLKLKSRVKEDTGLNFPEYLPE